MRPRVPPRAALHHRGRAEGAVRGTSFRRCSVPVSTPGRGWARCPPAAQVPRALPVEGSGTASRSESVPAPPCGGSPSPSQRPDDLVCCAQRWRSGACFAWSRGFRHCCVAVPKSSGWGADVPWLVRCSLQGWRRGVPGGAAFHHCEGRLVSGAVPPPATRPLERVAGVPRPVCLGRGRCGCGDPAPAPQRAPVRAGVARCGGGGKASPGGVPSTIV